MTEKDILKLVEETFGEEISTSCSETVLGLESWIDGKEAFMEKLAEKLKLLLIILCLFSVSCNKEKSLQKELSLVENEIRELSEYVYIDSVEIPTNWVKDYEKLKPYFEKKKSLDWQITLQNPYWIGKPYENVLTALSKYYNLNYIEEDDKRLDLCIQSSEENTLYDLKFNMQDANKIENIISDVLGFTPNTNDGLIWTTSKYSLEMFETGGHYIKLLFLLN